MVMQWPAKPSTPVRFRPQPPINTNKNSRLQERLFYVRYFLLA
jgi:hypothetical protein